MNAVRPGTPRAIPECPAGFEVDSEGSLYPACRRQTRRRDARTQLPSGPRPRQAGAISQRDHLGHRIG